MINPVESLHQQESSVLLTASLVNESKVVFSPAFVKNTCSISITCEHSPFANKWKPKIFSNTLVPLFPPAANSYSVVSSSIDKPGATTKSCHSSVNSPKGSPSGLTASANDNSNTLNASSPLKPSTKSSKSKVPSPTFLILNPIPS